MSGVAKEKKEKRRKKGQWERVEPWSPERKLLSPASKIGTLDVIT